jgi:hypothetical protein
MSVSSSVALAILMMSALACRAADAASSPEAPPPPAHHVSYVVHVDWKSQPGGSNSLQIVTAEGTFRLDGTQSSTAKVGDAEVPVSVNVNGDLKALDSEHGRLQLFLGRTVPYLTQGGRSPDSSSIQQRQEGLSSTFIVTFGKPVLLQKDGNGAVTVLVESVKP